MNLYRNDNLRAAFDLYVRRQDALLPTEEELSSVTLSPEFHARMAKLLARRKRGYYRMFGTWGRRVASILIALLIATTTVTVSVKALREKVIEFFTEVFDTHTAVTFVDETPDVPDEIAFEPRKPSYIPEGYVIEQEIKSSTMYVVLWADEKNNQVCYRQLQKESIEIYVDTEESIYTQIKINENSGITYSSKGFNYLMFWDDCYTYTLSGTVMLEKLVKVAESIV